MSEPGLYRDATVASALSARRYPMRTSLAAVGAVCGLLGFVAPSAGAQSSVRGTITTYTFGPGSHQLSLPANAIVTFDVSGAAGGDGNQGSVGGSGGHERLDKTLASDTTFTIIVGSSGNNGGAPDGGPGGDGPGTSAGTGGGSSRVLIGTQSLVVAGGGGGDGGGGDSFATQAVGGAAGKLVGHNGAFSPDTHLAKGGHGGTQLAGGAGGKGEPIQFCPAPGQGSTPGSPGAAGSGQQGGAGGADGGGVFGPVGGGGGGGGGYFGGGGGGGGDYVDGEPCGGGHFTDEGGGGGGGSGFGGKFLGANNTGDGAVVVIVNTP